MPDISPGRNDHADLVAMLAAARRKGRQIRLPEALAPTTAAAGYDAARMVSDALGWAPLGELLDPLVECEFFVTLAEDLKLRDAPWTFAEVRAAVGTVHAGIEVAECRFPNAALPPLPAVLADGAASGRYVYGDPIPDWQNGLADVAVVLEIDGNPKRHGSGQDVMSDPLVPLHWLAETLRRRGIGLAAGEMISTGSCTGMLPVRHAQRVVARFGADARVAIDFAE